IKYFSFEGVHDTFKDFPQHTSAHGKPRVTSLHGLKRIFWSITLILCIIAFSFQAKEIVRKFFRYDVIVGVEVKFEIVSFPAVTQIATLNQTKGNTLINKINLISDVICIYVSDGTLLWHCQDLETNVCENNDKQKTIPCKCYKNLCIRTELYLIRGKLPLQMDYYPYRCQRSIVANASDVCVCLMESLSITYCDDINNWQFTYCSSCTFNGILEAVSYDYTFKTCSCNDHYHVYLFFIASTIQKQVLRIKRQKYRLSEVLLSRYEAFLAVHASYECSSPDDQCKSIYGITNVQVGEKIKQYVNDLSESEKLALSYNKKEFITKCLRFQVLVNVSEYLPTIDSAGIRLTVHSQEEQAFPDTHGYSAPTGSVSSFGIKMICYFSFCITTLSYPYGDYVDDKLVKTSDYIYRDKIYSTEISLIFGCLSCGDPRFPPYKDIPTETSFASFNIDKLNCVCPQPCSLVISYRFIRSHILLHNNRNFEIDAKLLFYEQLNYETRSIRDFSWIYMITMIDFCILVAEVTTKSCYYVMSKMHGSIQQNSKYNVM
uniref:C2H2-type domain-containing protein n=1 Tax=Syphacia muris TaxID=451379 RepID=A0A0N5A8Y1_9BILA